MLDARRTRFVTIGTLALATTLVLAGCIGAGVGAAPSEQADESIDVDATVFPSGGETFDEAYRNLTGRSRDRAFEDGAVARFDRRNRTVVVVGWAAHSPDCTRLAVGDVRYDDGNATLVVPVRLRDVTDGGCNMTAVVTGYRVRATFDDGVPDRVLVRHRDEWRGRVQHRDVLRANASAATLESAENATAAATGTGMTTRPADR